MSVNIMSAYLDCRRALKIEREVAQARRQELLKSSPLVTLKKSYKDLVQKSEIYRVGILRKVATFGKISI